MKTPRNLASPLVHKVENKHMDMNWELIIADIPGANAHLEYGSDRNVFSQGQPAEAVFFLRTGQVKISVLSMQGKEAIVGIMEANDFFGEGCLAGQALRISSAITLTDCSLIRISKQDMTRVLHKRQDFSEMFISHLLSRNIRFEGDLVDQLFHNSEKRLARLLLLLAHFGKEGVAEAERVIPNVNQETLAQMVGTTRSRISHFMNDFRKHGFIDYTRSGDLTVVNDSLLNVILHD